MRSFIDLMGGSFTPSAVVLQSGVLVVFMGTFVYLMFALYGKEKQKICQDLGRKLIDD